MSWVFLTFSSVEFGRKTQIKTVTSEFLCHLRLDGAPGVEPVQVDAVVREPGKPIGARIVSNHKNPPLASIWLKYITPFLSTIPFWSHVSY